MSLDTSTLYLVASMIAALLGFMLLFFGHQENISALKWWGTAYLLGAGSVALWTVASSVLGEMLSLALNAVGFLTCGMVWNASRLFHGRKPNLPGLVLGALVALIVGFGITRLVWELRQILTILSLLPSHLALSWQTAEVALLLIVMLLAIAYGFSRWIFRRSARESLMES